MKHFFQNLNGWFYYEKLYEEMVARFPSGSKFVEIGSFEGRSLAYLVVEAINSGKQIDITSVDLLGLEWQFCNTYEGLYDKFKTNMQPVWGKFNQLRMRSAEASKLFADRSLDFCFIDATHSYEGCKEDIELYLPKMKPGSVIAGHDYCWPGPKQAVAEIFGTKFTSDQGQDIWRVELDENAKPK